MVAHPASLELATRGGTQIEEPPEIRGFFVKRLKRLELSTFCMASRRSSQLSYSRAEGGEYSQAWFAGAASDSAGGV
jgi:hypothetical protein